ncbi:hypothetical protein [uncultured Haliea sp.]|uniref:hypothetical protein n=1 Tax=uncultured Haliea sp. TaxID=622616 RepID=UPI0026A016F4
MGLHMQQAAEQVADVAQKAGSGVAVASGVWAWVGTNHQVISTIVGFIALLVTIAGIVFNIRHKRRVEAIMAEQLDRRRQQLNPDSDIVTPYPGSQQQ